MVQVRTAFFSMVILMSTPCFAWMTWGAHMGNWIRDTYLVSSVYTEKRVAYTPRSFDVVGEWWYQVEEGDSLHRIVSWCKRMNVWVRSSDIIKWNGVRKPDSLQPDMWLRIPIFRWNAEEGIASWYGPGFHGKRMANTKRFNQKNPHIAAHPTIPLGMKARVTNLDTGKSIIVRIVDRGPYVEGRILDLSKAAAKKLGYEESGLANVFIEPIHQPLS